MSPILRSSRSSSFLPTVLALASIAFLLFVCIPSSFVAGAGSCPAGYFCYPDNITQTDQIKCLPSQYCPGNQAGQICARGHYCPDPTLQLECPEGSYCPPGSIAPRPCGPLASCPAGSDRYFHWGTLVLLALFLPLLFSSGYIYDAINRRWNSSTSNKLVTSSPTGDIGTTFTVPRMSIKFDSLCAEIDVNGVPKTILADVSGHFRAGRVIAVMGPSGAGKSSLINVLTGGVRLKSGSIESRIEGSLESDLRHARKLGMIGVVPQSDIMISCLTPRDIITHSAYTRLPADWTQEQKQARIQETLKQLNLERVQYTPVGDEDVRGVSGGEKKRTNIGIELVNRPSLLILDEPTTGLDATSSGTLLTTLREISRSNTCVVAVLHQPRNEIFRGLDDLLLLAPGGRTVYFGPAREAQAYFTSIGYPCDGDTNPSDLFIDVIAGRAGPPIDRGESSNEEPVHESESSPVDSKHSSITSTSEIQSYLCSAWKDEPGQKFRRHLNQIDPPPSADEESNQSNKPFVADVKLPSVWYLIYLYCYRALLQFSRSISTLQLEMFMHILAGSVIGMAFTHDNWFIPPINPAYIPYCPEPLQRSCRESPVRDVTDLMTVYTVMALGLVSAIIGNRCYGQELVNMKRESGAGLSPSAYFWGKAISEIPLIVLYSFLYTVSFYCVASPGARFNDFYTTILLFEFVTFSIGYVSSLMLTGENALLLSAIAALLSGLATDNRSVIKNICWTRWTAEALYVSDVRVDLLQPPMDDIVQTYMDKRNKFDIDNYSLDLVVLLIYGLALRLWAYLLVVKRFYQRSPNKSTTTISSKKDNKGSPEPTSPSEVAMVSIKANQA